MTTNELIKQIAEMTGADEATVKQMATGTADHLERMFGDAEGAAEAVKEDREFVGAGVDSFMSAQRKMTISALTHPNEFTEAVAANL